MDGVAVAVNVPSVTSNMYCQLMKRCCWSFLSSPEPCKLLRSDGSWAWNYCSVAAWIWSWSTQEDQISPHKSHAGQKLKTAAEWEATPHWKKILVGA